MILKIGETLILECEDEDGEMKSYRCRLAEIREKELLIDYPIDEKTGKTPVLINGLLMFANYVRDGHVFRFRSIFVRRVPGNVPLMLLKYEGEESLEQIQRRNYVRVDANLDIAVHSLSNSFRPFTTVTSDIGGGGALIILPEKSGINEKDRIETWLSLVSPSGEHHLLRLKGEVVRVFQDRLTSGMRASIQFYPENEKQRQPIIRFCFEKQLESRKKLFEWGMDHHY